jgi:hypothetical protein
MLGESFGFIRQIWCCNHELEYIKALMARGRFIVTRSARRDAVGLGYATEVEIVERVLKVLEPEIHKTMPAEKSKNQWQDVYKSHEEDGSSLYISCRFLL